MIAGVLVGLAVLARSYVGSIQIRSPDKPAVLDAAVFSAGRRQFRLSTSALSNRLRVLPIAQAINLPHYASPIAPTQRATGRLGGVPCGPPKRSSAVRM
jgi:hypothetical protein